MGLESPNPTVPLRARASGDSSTAKSWAHVLAQGGDDGSIGGSKNLTRLTVLVGGHIQVP